MPNSYISVLTYQLHRFCYRLAGPSKMRAWRKTAQRCLLALSIMRLRGYIQITGFGANLPA
ncbi:MAG TPA: hypothetical protein VII29_16980, partial [Terriglobales bacterium]